MRAGDGTTVDSAAVNRAAIRIGIEALVEPGCVYEMRIPKAGRARTVSGYFDDLDALAAAAANWDGHGPGIYLTLNPVSPSLLGRASNRVKPHADATTSDKDVVCRRRFMIDIDPVRQSGIASTDAEHDAAIQRAREIHTDLGGAGWPPMLAIDTGNGARLDYAIDLPNDPESLSLVKRVLDVLAFRFSDNLVRVDTTVYNAARIGRIPGTLNAKGDSTPDRPHRRSLILSAPGTLVSVSREQLETLAATAPTAAPKGNGAAHGDFDLERWIVDHGIDVLREGPWQGGHRWLLRACPFNADHVGGSAAILQHASGAAVFRCLHNGCEGRDWSDLRQHFEPNVYDGAQRMHGQPLTAFTAYAQPPREWSTSLAPEAFHGPAGEFVRQVEPHTESDPAALLIQFLTMFGNVIGRSRYFAVEADRHYGNLFVVIVGDSSKARKGTSKSQTLKRFDALDPIWATTRLQSGLSSGEGLIWGVRNPIMKREPIKEKGRVVDYQDVEADPGIDDKRLLVFEAEFASVLRMIAREGNVLSAVVRDAWDRGDLRILTKSSPARATDAHISIIGHVTREELRSELTRTDAASGFGNRFLWVYATRSKLLPEGGQLEAVDFAPLHRELARAIEFARLPGEIRRDTPARERWRDIYAELSEAQLGLFGAVTSRAEAQVVRLSLIYALLDCAGTIQPQHLEAALAVWRYCEASAAHIFGKATGSALADDIDRALRGARNGLTRAELRERYQRNRSSEEIGFALDLLARHGRAVMAREDTGGRPAERWRSRQSRYAVDAVDAVTRPSGDSGSSEERDIAYTACASQRRARLAASREAKMKGVDR